MWYTVTMIKVIPVYLEYHSHCIKLRYLLITSSNPKWINGIKGPISIGKIRLLQLQFDDHAVLFTAFGTTILYYLYDTKIRTGR